MRIQSEGRISTRQRTQDRRAQQEDADREYAVERSRAWWRVAIRRVVARLVEWTVNVACVTYGDIAELHLGPCGRCVGKAVKGLEGGVQ